MQAKRFAARIGLIAAAAAVASVAVPGAVAPASAACSPKNAISGSNYHVRICGLPDYDQRRMAVNDLGAAKYDFTGLGAKNGSCHCVASRRPTLVFPAPIVPTRTTLGPALIGNEGCRGRTARCAGSR